MNQLPFKDSGVHQAYFRAYYQRPEIKERRRLYAQRPEVREKARKYLQHPDVAYNKYLYMENWWQRPDHRERRRWLQRKRDQRPEIKETRDKYLQRSSVKLRNVARQAIRASRGFVPLCPNEWSCPVDYHHVSPDHSYVVPLPRSVHCAVGGNSPFHYVFNASMICLLYGLGVLK